MRYTHPLAGIAVLMGWLQRRGISRAILWRRRGVSEGIRHGAGRDAQGGSLYSRLLLLLLHSHGPCLDESILNVPSDFRRKDRPGIHRTRNRFFPGLQSSLESLSRLVVNKSVCIHECGKEIPA